MTNYTLRDKFRVPPSHDGQMSGFEYRQPETGCWLDGKSLDGTTALVATHRATNSLSRVSIEEVNADIQSQICMRIGTGWCENDAEKKWNFPDGWDSVVAGSRTLAKLAVEGIKGKSPYVSQEEAERRAEICSNCFANQKSNGCISCGFFDMVRGLVAECGPSQSTSKDDSLNACRVCQCLLVKKVHVNGDIIKSGMSDAQKSAYADIPTCWCNDL